MNSFSVTSPIFLCCSTHTRARALTSSAPRRPEVSNGACLTGAGARVGPQGDGTVPVQQDGVGPLGSVAVPVPGSVRTFPAAALVAYGPGLLLIQWLLVGAQDLLQGQLTRLRRLARLPRLPLAPGSTAC